MIKNVPRCLEAVNCWSSSGFLASRHRGTDSRTSTESCLPPDPPIELRLPVVLSARSYTTHSFLLTSGQFFGRCAHWWAVVVVAQRRKRPGGQFLSLSGGYSSRNSTIELYFYFIFSCCALVIIPVCC
jgi:hypothetical protein